MPVSLTILLVLQASISTEETGRPWALQQDLSAQSRLREEAAGKDPARRLGYARWCGEVGLFERMHEVLSGLLDGGQEVSATAGLLGLEHVDDQWRYEELSRSSEERPAGALPTLVAPSAKTQDTILKGRYRDIRLANKSTYFDLWTDLSDEELDPYTKVLNSYYRKLKGHFRAYDPISIDVTVFKNRADYLIDFIRTFGESGEHVLGYYVSGRKLLVFYDDPFELAEVMVTARHECTHLLVDLSYGGHRIPAWLNEGLACFLAADGIEARGRYTSGLMLTLMQRLSNNQAIGIEELLTLRPEKLEYRHYAWSWALIHYLNQPPYEDQFQKFLMKLRSELTDEVKPEEVQQRVASVFRDSFSGDLGQLEGDWWYWFENKFRLDRPDQLVDLGFQALEGAHTGDKKRLQRLNLEIAQEAFGALGSSGEGLGQELRTARQLGLLSCRVRRTALDEPALPACRLMLRALLDGVRSLPELDNEALRSSLIREALEILVEAAEVRTPKQGPFDLRAGLRAAMRRASGSRKADLTALVVLADELLEVAFASQAKALAANPVHRQAASEWLLLANDYARSELPQIFDTLRLLVELDPDDRNLAALGLAYVGLGQEAWGQHLVKSGLLRSARPRALAVYAERAAVR